MSCYNQYWIDLYYGRSCAALGKGKPLECPLVIYPTSIANRALVSGALAHLTNVEVTRVYQTFLAFLFTCLTDEQHNSGIYNLLSTFTKTTLILFLWLIFLSKPNKIISACRKLHSRCSPCWHLVAIGCVVKRALRSHKLPQSLVSQ